MRLRDGRARADGAGGGLCGRRLLLSGGGWLGFKEYPLSPFGPNGLPIGVSRESLRQMDHPKDQPRFVWSTWTSCRLIGERIEVCESGW